MPRCRTDKCPFYSQQQRRRIRYCSQCLQNRKTFQSVAKGVREAKRIRQHYHALFDAFVWENMCLPDRVFNIAFATLERATSASELEKMLKVLFASTDNRYRLRVSQGLRLWQCFCDRPQKSIYGRVIWSLCVDYWNFQEKIGHEAMCYYSLYEDQNPIKRTDIDLSEFPTIRHERWFSPYVENA